VLNQAVVHADIVIHACPSLVCSKLLLLRIKVTSGVLTKSKSQCNFDSAIFHDNQIQVESSNVRYTGKVMTNSK